MDTRRGGWVVLGLSTLVWGGWAGARGDVLDPVKPIVECMVVPPAEPEMSVRSAWTSSFPLWPKGMMGVWFDAGVPEVVRQNVRGALGDLSRAGGVCFIENPGPGMKLGVTRVSLGDLNSSGIGYRSANDLTLINWERRGTILHEFMHSLGLFHEMSRPDRDNYVTVLTQNIDPSQGGLYLDQFSLKSYLLTDTPYDFLSVMHYHSHAFSRNDQPTILAKPGYEQYQDKMGMHSALSAGDRAWLVARYGATKPYVTRVGSTFDTPLEDGWVTGTCGGSSGPSQGTPTDTGVNYRTYLPSNTPLVPIAFTISSVKVSLIAGFTAAVSDGAVRLEVSGPISQIIDTPAWSQNAGECAERLGQGVELNIPAGGLTQRGYLDLRFRVTRLSGAGGLNIGSPQLTVTTSVTPSVGDRDNDGVPDDLDCAPDDPSRWRSYAFLDANANGKRDYTFLSPCPCWGDVPPPGFTMNNSIADHTCPCNKADLVDASGFPRGDCQLTSADVVTFITQFFTPCTTTSAPCNQADITDRSGTDVADGQVTPSDLVAFFQAFFAGCP